MQPDRSLRVAGAAPRRVAIVLMSAVGSTVQGMPIIASLRRAWPGTHITWVLQPGPATLMAGRPDVDRILLFHRSLGARAYSRFRREVAGETFDLVICLQPNFKGGMVTRLLRAPERLGHDRARARDLSWVATNRRIPPAPVAHIQDELFEFLDHLGVPRCLEWRFHFTAEERRVSARWRERFSRPVLAVVPRSSNARRNWTLEGTARVIDMAAGDLGLQPVLLGGDSEEELRDARRLGELCGAPPRVALGGTLRELAGRLDASDLVLAPDTGPLHMAVALGTPTIGLYGYTDPRRSGPYGRFTDLTVDRFRASAGSDGERMPSRATRRGRMSRIRVEDVVLKLERAIRSCLNS
ncbi:glycosyltransferase family 9 protein [Candidatus Palauibacter irciniicola]|uniref:glycosyltransferase family 9 protein n=1 Tax=Candidatus Palauibacter irciniicola TaxID=3056733 RepID=UPI003B0130AE